MWHILILLVNLIYLPTLKYGLVNDDSSRMKLEPFNVKRERIINILMHALIAQYIYFILGGYAGVTAAFLFSVHPAGVQVTSWISGKVYAYNALLFFLILAFAPYGAVLFFISNTHFPTVLFAPLVFVFTKNWFLVLLIPILCFQCYGGVKKHITGKMKGEGVFTAPLPADFDLHKFRWINLILVVKTFGYYALHCLLPIKNGFYNSFLVTLGASEADTRYWYSLNRHFWGGLFAIISMLCIWVIHRGDIIGMGVILFTTSLIPFLNFITIQQQTAPRYEYLPMAGFMMMLSGLVFYLPIVPRCLIIGALFLFYLDRTLRVMPHYKKDNITLIILDSQVFPDNPRLWYYRYEHNLYKNNPVMAWAAAAEGLKYLPNDSQLWFGLACASFEMGDMNAARDFLNNAKKTMILVERRNMINLIAELDKRITEKLEEKWK